MCLAVFFYRILPVFFGFSNWVWSFERYGGERATVAAPYRNGGGCRAQENTGAAVIAFVCFNSSTLGGRRLRSRRPPRPLSLPVSFFFWGGQVGPFTKNTDSTASDSMFSFDYDYFFATLSLRSNLFFCSLVARLFSAFFFCVGLCVPGAFLSVLFVFFCFHFVVFFSSHTKCSSSPPPTVFLSEGGPVTSGMCRPKCNRR